MLHKNDFVHPEDATALDQLESIPGFKPIVKKFPRKDKNVALNFLCYCIYGLNYKRAKLIVDTYQLESLSDLMKLNVDDLTNIEGIGKKTAENIIRSIK